MGLVEVGVGLIPAGGGTKEMLARAMEAAAAGADPLPHRPAGVRDDRVRQGLDQRPGRARVSATCAPVDGITMNRERLIADAKAVALAACHRLRRRRGPARRFPSAGEGLHAALKLGVHLAWRAGRISDHDALIGRTLARILAGGDRPHAGTVDRAAAARPRARGVPQPVRRAQDAGADRAHAEDRQDAEELTAMFDQGSGPALVVVPGLQGRWEWMKPALRSSPQRCRAISYSLCGDIGSGERLARRAGLRQLPAPARRGARRRGPRARSRLCGVSFGGFVALRYAATRPDRVTALVLASAPGPGWQPNRAAGALAGSGRGCRRRRSC